MNKAERIKAKTLRKHSDYFKRLYKEATKNVRRSSISKDDKKAIINDLQECNNMDIMHYLTMTDFKDKEDFIHRLDKWLSLESLAYQYNVIMKYEIGNLGYLTEKIRKHHNFRDLKNKVYGR